MSTRSISNRKRREVSEPGRPDAGRSAESPLKTLIASQPFFKGMTVGQVELLADSAMHTEFATGQIIFRQGDPANRFYLIESGNVALELERRDRGAILIQTIGPGRELGWSWILPPYYEHFMARALEATKAIFFYGTRLRAQCDENHDLGYELMSRMAAVMLHRIEAVSRQLLECHARDS